MIRKTVKMNAPFRKYSFGLICMLLFALNTRAQELQCNVEVLGDKIQNVDAKVFMSLKKSLADFLNNRKWTTDNFKPSEKIECNFLLTIESMAGENTYKASLNIQASRPVFNTDYNTPTVNYVDRDVVFKFVETQVLNFDDNRVSGSNALESNLTAVFAYYAYLIIGLDYNSFQQDGGLSYLKRAQNVVNNAPEEGKQITGWKATEGTRNRYWLIDQMLSPRFSKFSEYWYRFHRLGLDRMSQLPDEARKTILDGIATLTEINNDNPSSILMQFFFNAKTNEFVNILTQTPAAERKDYVSQLSRMDVPGSARYRSIK